MGDLALSVATAGEIGDPAVIFAHGWGRTRADFAPVADTLAPYAGSLSIDLPGFGDSAKPDAAWSTEDYAGFLRDRLRSDFGVERCIWVGHSFGGRVGLRLAVAAPEFCAALVLIAAAGIPRRRAPIERARGEINRRRFQYAKSKAADEAALIALEKRFGSADYVRSRETGMRDIFLKTVAEDQSPFLGKIRCRTTLIYGGLDDSTPVELGERMRDMIDGAELIVLDHADHLSILSRGRHQIALAIKEAIDRR